MHIMKKLTYTCILFLCGLSCNRQDDEKPVINNEPLSNDSQVNLKLEISQIEIGNI
jgi:hypothetical protein